MLPLYERIEQLAKQHGFKNITELCTASGASRGSLTDLKSGRKKNLSADTLAKIADCLNVSIDELAGREIEHKEEALPLLTKKDERDIARQLERMLGQLGASDDALMFDGEPLDAETQELLRISLENQLRMTKQLAKQKYTPKKYRKK